MKVPWIYVTTTIGAFVLATTFVVTGYYLFLAGAQGQFKFHADTPAGSVGLESVAPGIGFAFAGLCIGVYAIHRLIKR